MAYLLFVVVSLTTLSALCYAWETPEMYATASSLAAVARRPRGRPRKFDGPSRAVTLTLPEDVIARLSEIHRDLSRAVVTLARKPRRASRRAADLLVFGKRAVITIRPTPSLEMRAGVQLVPLPDGRALISLDTPASLAALQLSLHDALEDGDMTATDRAVYENLRDLLRDARRSADVTLHQRQIIVLEAARFSRAKRSLLRRKH